MDKLDVVWGQEAMMLLGQKPDVQHAIREALREGRDVWRAAADARRALRGWHAQICELGIPVWYPLLPKERGPQGGPLVLPYRRDLDAGPVASLFETVCACGSDWFTRLVRMTPDMVRNIAASVEPLFESWPLEGPQRPRLDTRGRPRMLKVIDVVTAYFAHKACSASLAWLANVDLKVGESTLRRYFHRLEPCMLECDELRRFRPAPGGKMLSTRQLDGLEHAFYEPHLPFVFPLVCDITFSFVPEYPKYSPGWYLYNNGHRKACIRQWEWHVTHDGFVVFLSKSYPGVFFESEHSDHMRAAYHVFMDG